MVLVQLLRKVLLCERMGIKFLILINPIIKTIYLIIINIIIIIIIILIIIILLLNIRLY